MCRIVFFPIERECVAFLKGEIDISCQHPGRLYLGGGPF
jgi:hypothetical protein